MGPLLESPSSDAMLPGGSLRALKKNATRRALERCTLELAVERGYERITVDEIAAAAGVSTRTFFNYFACKEDAVFGMVKDSCQSRGRCNPQWVLAMVNAQPADVAPLAALRAALLGAAADMVEDKELWRIRDELNRRHPALAGHMAATFTEHERLLADAVAQRSGTDVVADAYPLLTAGAAIAAIRSALQRWFASESSSSLTELVEEAFDALATGLIPPNTRR